MAAPVIIELAVNGATPRSANPHVPRTPEEITEVAVAAIERGAAIVHNHNDEPMFTADGVHAVEPYVSAWTPVLARHPDALLYPTMGAGARGIPVQVRWAHVEELARRGLGGSWGRRPASRCSSPASCARRWRCTARVGCHPGRRGSAGRAARPQARHQRGGS